MAGETSAGGVQWVHRQFPIVWRGGTVSIVSYDRWDRAPKHRQGVLDWALLGDGTATIVVASIRGGARPNDVEIRLYGSTIDAALDLQKRI